MDNEILHIVAHPNEDISTSAVGHLQFYFGACSKKAVVNVPAVTLTQASARLISSLFLFPNLTSLEVIFDKPTSIIRQRHFCSVSELAGLRSFSLKGGSLDHTGCKLEVLSSLRNLDALVLRPSKASGLGDDHVEGISWLSTSLRTLSFRGDAEMLTDIGLLHLTRLRALTQLHIVPLGLGVSKQGVTTLLASLPALQSLAVGFQHVGQVNAVRDLTCLPSISIIVNDPGASHQEWSGLVTSCTLCMCNSLVTLRLGKIKMEDNMFLVALGTLTALTELKMLVSPVSFVTPHICCDISVLTNLQRLETFDFSCVSSVGLPFTPRIISLLALGWKQIRSLGLSIMGKRLIPESLALLDLFSSLRSLSLCCPVDFSEEESPGQKNGDPWSGLVPLNLTNLPDHIEHLHLEYASISAPCTPANLPSNCVRLRRLPSLISLELNDCLMNDATLHDLLQSSTGLSHLELNSVSHLSGPGLLNPCSNLRNLEHVVFCNVSCTGLGLQPLHLSLNLIPSALSTSSQSLRHLEWSPSWSHPMSASDVQLACTAFSKLPSLRFLYLNIKPNIDSDHSNQGGFMEALQKKLPLCTITTTYSSCCVDCDIYEDSLT